MKTFEEWRKTRKYHMAVTDAETAWHACAAEWEAEVTELKEKLAGDEQRVKDISRLTMERDDALEKIERVKGILERCEKSASDPKLLTRSTYKWFADDLRAALEVKE